MKGIAKYDYPSLITQIYDDHKYRVNGVMVYIPQSLTNTTRKQSGLCVYLAADRRTIMVMFELLVNLWKRLDLIWIKWIGSTGS